MVLDCPAKNKQTKKRDCTHVYNQLDDPLPVLLLLFLFLFIGIMIGNVILNGKGSSNCFWSNESFLTGQCNIVIFCSCIYLYIYVSISYSTKKNGVYQMFHCKSMTNVS